jgi:Uncharacterised nucleotidyltransferase
VKRRSFAQIDERFWRRMRSAVDVRSAVRLAPGRPLPNRFETLLLRASLLEGEPARAAFAQWRKDLDVEALDFGSQRILPLLNRNLRGHLCTDPLAGRFQGVARYAWYMNQVLTAAVVPVIRSFDRAGIEVLALKGMALVGSLPEQIGLRAMTDIDLLVHPCDLAVAMNFLTQGGWWPWWGTIRFVLQEWAPRTKSCEFTAGRNRQLDLHWFMFDQTRWPEADVPVWSRSIPVKIGGENCRAPSFEDQLIHACVHGAPWNGIGTLRWAADSVTILRAVGPRFDWDYLVEESCRRRVVLQVRSCLHYLLEALDQPVPATVLRRLQNQVISPAERIDYCWRAQDPSNLSSLARHFLAVQDMRGSSRPLFDAPFVAVLAAWLRQMWAVDSTVAAVLLGVAALVGSPRWLLDLIMRSRPSDWRRKFLAERRPNLGLRDAIDLSLSGDAGPSLLYGWSMPETEGRWTEGRQAAIVVDLGSDAGAIQLEIWLSALLVPAAPQMFIDIWANRRRLARWNFVLNKRHAGVHRRTLDVPAVAVKGRYLVLTFLVSHPQSLKSLGLSNDGRHLGIFVRRLSFRRPETLRPDSPGADNTTRTSVRHASV